MATLLIAPSFTSSHLLLPSPIAVRKPWLLIGRSQLDTGSRHLLAETLKTRPNVPRTEQLAPTRDRTGAVQPAACYTTRYSAGHGSDYRLSPRKYRLPVASRRCGRARGQSSKNRRRRGRLGADFNHVSSFSMATRQSTDGGGGAIVTDEEAKQNFVFRHLTTTARVGAD